MNNFLLGTALYYARNGNIIRIVSYNATCTLYSGFSINAPDILLHFNQDGDNINNPQYDLVKALTVTEKLTEKEVEIIANFGKKE